MDESDFDGHGSNVSSIIGSEDPVRPGMATGTDIIHLKVFSSFTGGSSFSDIEAALQWVVANAATFNIASVNISLGDGENYSSAVTSLISDELSQIAALGIITVSDSGNSFFEFNGSQGAAYPADDPNSLSVGAVYGSNIGSVSYLSGASAFTTTADRLTPFSQRYDTLTDIFAPGSSITGANQSGGLVSMYGTSQAPPHIAGIAVLAQRLAEQEIGRRLDPSEFVQVLKQTGVVINDGDYENDNVSNTGFDFHRVDVFAMADAIAALAPGTPVIDMDDVTVAEGDSGITDAVFTVTLSETSQAPVTVDYANSDLSTSAGSDYIAVNGTLTIPGGELSNTVTMEIIGDTFAESNEIYGLTLSNGQGADFGGGSSLNATGTILNDDFEQTELSIAPADAQKQEGDTGHTLFTFTVRRSGDLSGTTTVDYTM